MLTEPIFKRQVMIPEACRKPVPKQPGWEPVRSQKTGLVHMPNVRDGHRACPSQSGKVSNPGEERLHMVRNAKPQGVEYGVRDSFFDL